MFFITFEVTMICQLKSFFMLIGVLFSARCFAQTIQPNYDSLRYWASHPDKVDAADITEKTTGFEVDVFFYLSNHLLQTTI